jgi:regulator of sigma E protease
MDGEDSSVESGESRVESPGQKTDNKKLTSDHFFPFYQRPLWQKILVVLAGPAVNIIFGMIVFSTLYSLYGIPQEIHIPPTITAISENSPAQKSGIKENDVVISISKNDGSEKKDTSAVKEIIAYVNAHRGETLKLTVNRDGSTQSLDVYARKESEIPAGQGTIGVSLSDVQIKPKFYPGIEQVARGTIFGVTQSLKFGKTILVALGGIGSSLLSGHIPGDVAGPVGIAHEVQKQDLFASGWASTFNFAALLSINLGVMNLLPIPALDGGRIFLLLLEKFVKHKNFEKISNNLNQFGFIFLIGLLILITIKDVIGLLH